MLPALASTTRRTLSRIVEQTPSFRGKMRAVRSLDRALRSVDHAPVQKDVDGVVFELNSEDLIDFGLLYNGGFQRNLARYITTRLGAGPRVFWDVGANIGSICLPVASMAPQARVVAFEPSPPVRARLMRNLALNPTLAARIQALGTALSDVDGETDFFVSNETFNSGVGGLGHAHNRETQPVRVPVARADALIGSGQAPAPDLIKIDVEGFEHQVLAGMGELLRTDRPLELIFEHYPYRLEETGQSREHNANLMREHGFSLHIFAERTGSSVRALEPGDLDTNCDIIARRGV